MVGRHHIPESYGRSHIWKVKTVLNLVEAHTLKAPLQMYVFP